MLNWIVFNRNVYGIKMDLAWNDLQGLICHNKQTLVCVWLYGGSISDTE